MMIAAAGLPSVLAVFMKRGKLFSDLRASSFGYFKETLVSKDIRSRRSLRSASSRQALFSAFFVSCH